MADSITRFTSDEIALRAIRLMPQSYCRAVRPGYRAEKGREVLLLRRSIVKLDHRLPEGKIATILRHTTLDKLGEYHGPDPEDLGPDKRLVFLQWKCDLCRGRIHREALPHSWIDDGYMVFVGKAVKINWFKVADGDSFLLNGERTQVKYIDDSHFEINGTKWEVSEFSDSMSAERKSVRQIPFED